MTSTSTESIQLGAGVPIARIVVPITLDHHYDRGVGLAARLAAKWELPIRLLSVDLSPIDAVNLTAGEAIEAARKALTKSRPNLTVDDILISSSDDAIQAAADAMEPSDLVVMATAAADGDRSFSFAQSFAQRWGGPVIMVGPNADLDTFAEDGDVAVAVDGSAMAERVLPAAVGLAEALNRPLHVVHVLRPEFTEHIARLKEQGEPVSESAYVRNVVGQLADPSMAEWVVLHDENPVEALVGFAASRSLSAVVMGTHGASGIVRPTFGSTTMQVVAQADRPVLVQVPMAVPPLELK
ncbi:MAG: universal stress protein [Acidimicrobiales bacterium]|nr:universal stress protein [Acidimicrobiales bacterium]